MKLFEMLDLLGEDRKPKSVVGGALLEPDLRYGFQFIDAPITKIKRLDGSPMEGGDYPKAALFTSSSTSASQKSRKYLEIFANTGGDPIPASQINLKQIYADYLDGVKKNFSKLSSISQVITKGFTGKVPIAPLTGITASPYKFIVSKIIAQAVEGAYNEMILNGDGIKAFNADFDWSSVEETIKMELENPENLTRVVRESEVEHSQFPINVWVTLSKNSKVRLSDYYAHNITAVLQERYGKLGTSVRDRDKYVEAVKSAHNIIAGERGFIGKDRSGDANVNDPTDLVGSYTTEQDPNNVKNTLSTELGHSKLTTV